MEVIYYKDPYGNVGDDLNEWIWKKYIPDLLKVDSDISLLGVGTLINDKLPKDREIITLGSGFGYGNLPGAEHKLSYLFVRGPFTCKKLGLPIEKAITDPAILLREHYLDRDRKIESKVGYIPHHDSLKNFDYRKISPNIKFIDVSSNLESFLEDINSCEVVVCEAMHGAIFADSLDIPWIPACSYPHINKKKWLDWSSTIEVDIDFLDLPEIYSTPSSFGYPEIIKNMTKRALKSIGIYKTSWDQPSPKPSSRKEILEWENILLSSIEDRDFYLSKTKLKLELISKIKESLSKLRYDILKV